MRRRVRVFRMGLVPYGEALTLQNHLQRARQRGAVPDTWLLLSHPPVFTLGRGAKESHLLRSREALAAEGFEVHDIGRGGDVTYHGPGQITGYPILDLSPDRKDVRRYVRDLEELMIRVTGRYGLAADRMAEHIGAWIGPRKVGAIGVRISRWVTLHGFALNVNTRLQDFGRIVPCGIADRGVTSLAAELGRPVDEEEVLAALEETFGELFDATLERGEGHPLAGVDPAAYGPERWERPTA